MVKNLPANAEDTGSVPQLGRATGGGNGSSLQYSCLGNSMDRGSWQVIVHGVAESDTTEPAHTYTHPLDRNWGRVVAERKKG